MRDLFVIKAPRYEKAWNLRYVVNGDFDAENKLPVPDCPKCEGGSCGRSYARSLPREVERELQRLPKDAHERRSLTLSDLDELRKVWSSTCPESSGSKELPYGARFPEWKWYVPSIPSVNGFYWHLNTIAVGSLVRKCFDAFGLKDVAYSQLSSIEIGTLDPANPSSFPETDDIDSLLAASDNLVDASSVGEFYFFEPLICTWRDQLNAMSSGPCVSCGRPIVHEERLEALDIQTTNWTKRRVIPRKFAPGVDLFFSHIYSSLVVSHELFEVISTHKLANFESLRIKVVG